MNQPSFAEAFAHLFSLSGLVAFLGGVIATFLYNWAIDRIRDMKYPQGRPHRTQFKSLLILWVLIYLVVGYIALQEQYQANKIRQLTEDTARCQKEFFTQLKVKFEQGEDTDRWSAVKTKALSDWMHDLLVPPPDIAAKRLVNPNDEAVLQWGLQVTARYDGIIQEAQNEQDRDIAERQAHPLPEATCGK